MDDKGISKRINKQATEKNQEERKDINLKKRSSQRENSKEE